ncbi:hypothetical protein F3Y22_tig00111101pilonHSYRG00077 [Hibiscus syriacus]|uniref:Uncharacterized protein n=1 Tax=Hibiscus syriacus TaxID=106335 RepID=A0A6A2Z004_HIBSY|nr:hypothetical protein F3Y22_tig00111101pilonHSYRG00077 [Hibiscus syriacus]
MADKHGPLYSLKLGTHRVLVVSSWEFAKDCFTTNDRTLATRASIAAGRHIGYNNAVFGHAPYGEYWRDIRKMVTVELLSSHRLEKLKHIRFSEMDLFIKELYGLCSQKGAENIAKRFYGDAYSKVNSEPWRYERAIKQTLYLSGIFVLADALPYLEWLYIQGHIRSMKKTAKELDSILTLTGGESTSVAITRVLSLLLNHPNVLKAVRDELDHHVGQERLVEESDIKNLKYLQAIVKETLRLYPPGPIMGIREATQDCRVAGYDVPKGTL